MHRILSLGDMACTNGTNKGLVNVIIITKICRTTRLHIQNNDLLEQ